MFEVNFEMVLIVLDEFLDTLSNNIEQYSF